MQNEISKGGIRTQMNLIFAMMRLLATILNMAKSSQLACDTLDTTAESIFEQAAILYRDIRDYTSSISGKEIKGRDTLVPK